MKILVTGGTGFIGYHLLQRLLSGGHQIRGLIRKTSRVPIDLQPHIDWYYGELRDLASLRAACQGQEIIIHLAGVIKSPKPNLFYQINLDGTERLLKAFREQKSTKGRFIYISSLAAGGPSKSRVPMTEDSPAAPVSHYGRSKYAAEEALRKTAGELKRIIIRPCTVYGPGDRETLHFFKIARFHIIPQIGWHRKLISMIHVEDLVQIIYRSLSAEVPSFERFYAADSTPGYSISTIIKTAASLLGGWTVPIYIPQALLAALAALNDLGGRLSGFAPTLNLDKYREIKQHYWTCSARKARQQLQYEPRFDLVKGFADTIKWYQQKGWL